VAEDDGEQALRIGAGAGELIGVAHASGAELDEDLARLGAFEIHLVDDERLADFECDRCASLHRSAPWLRERIGPGEKRKGRLAASVDERARGAASALEYHDDAAALARTRDLAVG
jgi:hypothetical protein